MKKDIFGDVISEVFELGGKIELVSKKDKRTQGSVFLMFIKIPVPFPKRSKVQIKIKKKQTIKKSLSEGRIFYEDNRIVGIILVKKPIFYKGISGGFLKKIKTFLED